MVSLQRVVLRFSLSLTYPPRPPRPPNTCYLDIVNSAHGYG